MTKDDIIRKIVNSTCNRKGCWPQMIVGLILILILISSCATKTKIEYVDREVVKYEYKTLYDTLIYNTHDSIYETVYQKGDTIYNVKYKEIVRYKDKIKYQTDTIYKDSIQNVVNKETVTKKIIPKWCYYCLLFSILCTIFAIYNIIKWLRSQA